MRSTLAAHGEEMRALLGADLVCFWQLDSEGAAHADVCVPPDWLIHPFQLPLLPSEFELTTGPACRGRLPMLARRQLPADLTASAVVQARRSERWGFFAFWARARDLPKDLPRLSAMAASSWQRVGQAKAEYEQIASASLQLSSLIGALPQGVAVVAPEGRPSRLNHQAATWLALKPGPTDSALLAQALSRWVSRAGNHHQIREAVNALLRQDTSTAVNFQVEFANPLLIVQLTVAPIDHTSSEGWVWLMQDITAEHLSAQELKQAIEQADRASQAKTAFLATMSHELRTPLNAVLGFSQVLEDSLTQPEAKRQARYIRETGETLNTILNDILDVAKIEAGKFDLDPRPFEIAQVFESCSSIFRVIAADAGIEFAMNLPSGLPPLLGDPIRLRQIVQNLLSNAFKFTAAGHVHATLQVLDQHPKAGTIGSVCLQLTVTDSGIGMTDEQLQRLFQRFEQADRTTAARFGGTGLGLAIVEALVSMMRGDVTVHSQWGYGSTFTVTLPFDIAPTGLPPSPSVDLSSPDQPLRVLVVDDFPVNRLVIRALLEKRGHKVTEAENGVQALDRVTAVLPDLVLMDLDMPVLDGLQATQRLRALTDDRLSGVPVYALTGKAFPEDVALVSAAGMNGHLSKPVQLPELVRVLKTVAYDLSACTDPP